MIITCEKRDCSQGERFLGFREASAPWPHAKAQRRKGFGLEDKKDNKDDYYNDYADFY